MELSGMQGRSISPGRSSAVVTVVATTTTISAAAATATAAAATLLFLGLFNRHFFPFQTGAIEGFYRFAGFSIAAHVYKAKAPALPGFPVHDDFGGN